MCSASHCLCFCCSACLLRRLRLDACSPLCSPFPFPPILLSCGAALCAISHLFFGRKAHCGAVQYIYLCVYTDMHTRHKYVDLAQNVFLQLTHIDFMYLDINSHTSLQCMYIFFALSFRECCLLHNVLLWCLLGHARSL